MITGEKVLLKFESMDYIHDEHDVCWEKKNYDEINASGKLMNFMFHMHNYVKIFFSPNFQMQL